MKRRENRGKSPRIQNFLRHSVNSLPGVSFYIREEPTVKDAAGEKNVREEESLCQS